MRRSIAVLAGLMLVMVALPSAQAHDVADVSGGCDDDGDASEYPAGQNVFRDEEADVSAGTSGTDLPDVLDTVHALGNLAEGQAGAGDGPTNACDGTGSWLSVSLAGDIVVCYDGDARTDTTTGDGYNPGGECNHHDGAGSDNQAVTSDAD